MRQITIMAAGMSTHTLDTHAVMMMAMKRRSSWQWKEEEEKNIR